MEKLGCVDSIVYAKCILISVFNRIEITVSKHKVEYSKLSALDAQRPDVCKRRLNCVFDASQDLQEAPAFG